MHLKIIASAIATLLPPGTAPTRESMLIYPAMTVEGRQYAVRVDGDGAINRCDALDTSITVAAAEADCARLKARGIPADVTPARSRTDPASWIGPDDYPAKALGRGEGGAAVIAMVVGNDGRIAECRIQASSGSAEIDAAGCAALKRRARFDPALYKGKPVLAVRVETFRMWTP